VRRRRHLLLAPITRSDSHHYAHTARLEDTPIHPRRAQADLGIAISAGTDVTVEAGDIILLESDPADVLATIRLSKPTVGMKHHRRVERAPGESSVP
jgi:hypothetical protein